METILEDTPVALLTVGQLKEALGLNEKPETPKPTKRFVYGISGIRDLFNVSHVTAHLYKNTIIKEAVSQNGRVIITDVDKALELFQKKSK